jgi:hypothetical protein
MMMMMMVIIIAFFFFFFLVWIACLLSSRLELGITNKQTNKKDS